MAGSSGKDQSCPWCQSNYRDGNEPGGDVTCFRRLCTDPLLLLYNSSSGRDCKIKKNFHSSTFGYSIREKYYRVASFMNAGLATIMNYIIAN